MTDLVAIEPDKAELLERAIGRAAARLRITAEELRGLDVGGPLGAWVSVSEMETWLDEQSRVLRWLVAEVRSWSGRVPPGVGVVLWAAPDHASLTHPGPAHRAAIAAAAAVTSGNRDAASDLLREWGDDPVFAATFLHELGPGGVVRALAAADELWSAPPPHGPSHRELVTGLARTLATATLHPGGGLSLGDLAGAADRSDSPRRLLGLLFLTPVPFSTAFLVDGLRQVVLPINRAVIRGASTDAYRVAGRHDARALVIAAVARDLDAARRALAGADLDLLLPAELGYLDAGRAVGDLLVAGTAPRTTTGGPISEPLLTGQIADLGLAAANLRRVVDWVASSGHLAPGVQHALGEVARPWIGSFRSGGLDAAVALHVDLDEGAARAFLQRASAREEGARHLRRAAWGWATTEVVRLSGPGYRGAAGFEAVGSVLGIVSIAGHDAAVAAAAESDARDRARRELWDDVAGGVLRRASPWLPVIAGRGVDATLEQVLPAGRLELVHWREVRDAAIGTEYLALDYLVVSELWRQRPSNHYFDGPTRQPPASILVGAAVRPLAGLGERATADYLRWRSALAADRPGPMQAAGERFLAEGRE